MIKLALFILLITSGALLIWKDERQISPRQPETVQPTPPPKLQIPEKKILENGTHVFQTFNNCGPAALSMALSYYGINISQQELGQALRPYQIPGGDNDDKSVTLEELAEKSKEYNLIPYHRPNGDIEMIKNFIAYDIPIVTRTWTKPNEDIGHYRVIKGYSGETIIQDDSLQGKNLSYTQSEFNAIWKKFNYEYLVLVSIDKQEIAEIILGENKDPKIAWQKALRQAQGELDKNPDDITARFNLSVAYANVGDYQGSIKEFERVENRLSFRTLWYQIEPIEAYYNLGNYNKVLEITYKILNNQNRAFSELYILRAKVYKEQGKDELIKPELEKARLYNVNLKIPQI